MKSLFALIFLASLYLYAFPEMIRHNYVNCTSCHVSPSGGGVLTQYGRALSKEILTSWGTEDEAKFLHGLFSTPEWLNMGGDVRVLQLYRNNPVLREAKIIWMQSDLEAAGTYDNLTVVGTAGYREYTQSGDKIKEFISRRHYIMYKPNDEVSIRVGRFMPDFGINTPEHTLVIRDGLGFNQASDATGETYNVELSWLGEKYNAYLTWIGGRPDKTTLDRETGVSATGSLFFGEGYKVGLNYLYASNNRYSRHLFGPYGILGFSKNFFLLTQFDFQKNTSKVASADPVWSGVSYNRLNYEVVQGLHVYLSHQLSQRNLNDGQTVFRGYGAGVQFFPRPHIDLQALWEKQQTLSLYPDMTDMAWLLVHYYL